MSELLETGLNRASLAAIAHLVDAGVNPYTLSHAVRELRREKESR